MGKRLDAIKATYHRYERFLPAATFFGGTLFDILTIGRIDQWSNLLQLGVYLGVIAVMLTVEIVDEHAPFQVPPRWQKAWKYREEVTHFFLGSLLSAFTIFYFKSASLLPSFVFFLIIAGLLVGNEFSALRRIGLTVRTILFAVCLTSYLACVTPVWWGHLGWLPFLTALLAAAASFAALLWVVMRWVDDKELIRKRVAGPFAATLATFLLFYAAHLIPPVPLSLTRIGVYHDVERVKGGYRVTWLDQGWKIWRDNDKTFVARPGDRLYCFFSVFSPTGFRDSVKVRWLYHDDEKGWQGSDATPVSITGGREEGFRGFAFKANYKPGDWQARIETSDDREIGRIYLTVVPAEPGEARDAREAKTEVL